MIWINLLIAMLVIVKLPSVVFAQSHQVSVSVPKVALISLAGNTNDHFSFASGGEAGHKLEITGHRISGIWLNYSSTLENNGKSHKITATMSGQLPDALQVLVEASPCEGSHRGNTGRPNGQMVLSGQPSEIISDIGNCHTGRGINNGHLLTYTLKWNEEASTGNLYAENHELQIVYTISE
jgi:hypothetical protein